MARFGGWNSFAPVSGSARLAAVALLLLVPEAASQPIQLTNVTSAAGLDHIHQDPKFLMGAGGAFLDYDGDGWQDVLLVGSIKSPILYRNQQDGTFVNVTASAGLPIPRKESFAMAAACADYDNDGDVDLYLMYHREDSLYRNDGGVFTDVTAEAGITNSAFTSGAAFGDYDGDGWLDLYVGNYIQMVNFPYHVPSQNRMFRNRGDGTFEDTTFETGTAGAGTTLAVSFSDFDDDGDLDLWVGNDFGEFVEPNRLYRNDGPSAPGGRWEFTEVSEPLGADPGIYCMGIAAGDLDRDLDLDYYFTNLGRNVLLRNDGDVGFADITTEAGVEVTYDPFLAPLFATSWGTGFHDFDRDGWVDLYVLNGHIPAAEFIVNSEKTPNSLFRNLGDGTFADVSFESGAANQKIGRGAAFADYDNDGDIDVWQCNIKSYPALLRNDSRNDHHWLRVVPEGRISSRDGVGTRVIAQFEEFALIREANPCYSFEVASDPAVHFGLGDRERVPELVARWLSGVEQNLLDVPAGQSLPLVEPLLTVDGEGTTAPKEVSPGEALELLLTVRNHMGAALTAYAAVELRFSLAGAEARAGGESSWQDEVLILEVGAARSASIVHSIEIPAHHLTEGVDRLDVIWTVIDAGGGIDQWSTSVAIIHD